MRNLSELNINDGGSAVTRARPTDGEFANFEARYKVTVPNELRALLRHSNGGCPELDSLEANGQSWSLNHFLHLAEGEGTDTLAYALTHWRPILGPHALVFGEDGGGNPYFIDLADGAVNICLHDEEMKIVRIATSFEAFIDSLELDEEMI